MKRSDELHGYNQRLWELQESARKAVLDQKHSDERWLLATLGRRMCESGERVALAQEQKKEMIRQRREAMIQKHEEIASTRETIDEFKKYVETCAIRYKHNVKPKDDHWVDMTSVSSLPSVNDATP